MKKIIKVISSVLAALLVLFSFEFITPSKTLAASVQSSSVFETTANAILNGFVTFDSRVAGTEGEKNASEYIKNYLDTETSLTPKNDAYVTDGVQSFTFESTFTSLFEKSQNIIYTLSSSQTTEKKIILACSYDAVAYKENSYMLASDIVSSESVAGSAGSVATLLALAKFLPSLSLKYNVEVVFFGAGESNNAGSNAYARGISDEEKENIVCAINLDKIAVGKNVYFYVDEIENAFSKLVSKISSENKLKTTNIDTYHLNKQILSEENELGLSYTHIALNSNNYTFKKTGIQTLSLLAGDYSDGVVIGRSEYEGYDAVCYTQNDNREYITKTYGDDAISKNMYEVYKLVCLTLTDADLETAVAGAAQTSSWFNAIFANPNLPFYLTVVAFIIFVIIAMFVYYKLSIKAYNANVEIEFVSTVMKISEHIEGENINEETAKAISQKIAGDIKKDKTIKRKKDKK
jgi:hypothetical protein